MSEPKTLLLTETGVEWLPDGSTAVNVGPIVRALRFLTEGRGDDRGTDEHGNPLPDLMSLAFDVVESIIVGGRKADYFRRVKRELDAQGEAGFQSSLLLARQAKRVQLAAPSTPLDRAADSLRALLAQLPQRSLDEAAAHELQQSLEAFRSFGADRWVSATAQLLAALNVLGVAPPGKPARQRAQSSKRRKPSAGVTAAKKRALTLDETTRKKVAKPQTKRRPKSPKRRSAQRKA